jgi:hypothetical protein
MVKTGTEITGKVYHPFYPEIRNISRKKLPIFVLPGTKITSFIPHSP